MMELGEEPKIIEEVESIVVSQHFPITDENDSQGSNSEASITPLMRDEAFYKVVKPHIGRLFGLRTSQMENYDHIDPPAVVINLTGMVKLMSQQLTALCEARRVTASDASTNPSPYSPPTINEQRI
ncbi:hypothetical protein N665_0589s0003 [Sinapis alba]|nr:hypothetical protein N665_0589s0003 [Sinapis alba]